ncbi:MAG: hypothetical protein AAF235_09445 [Planctomycetota bacterium]
MTAQSSGVGESAGPSVGSGDGFDPSLSVRRDWEVRIEPAVGYFAPSGDLRLPAPMSAASANTFSLEEIDLDSPRISPYGELTITKGKWSIMATGLGLSIDGGSISPIAGRVGDAPVALTDRIETSLDYASFSLRAGYRVWSWTDGVTDRGVENLSVGVDAMLGLRVQTVEFDSRVVPAVAPAPGTPTTASADETYVEALAGGALSVSYRETLGLDFFFSGGGMPGGDDSSTTLDLGVSFSYRPVAWVGGEIGYRLLVLDMQSGNGPDTFEWDGAVAGLYWGVQFRF